MKHDAGVLGPSCTLSKDRVTFRKSPTVITQHSHSALGLCPWLMICGSCLRIRDTPLAAMAWHEENSCQCTLLFNFAVCLPSCQAVAMMDKYASPQPTSLLSNRVLHTLICPHSHIPCGLLPIVSLLVTSWALLSRETEFPCGCVRLTLF